MSYIPVKIRKEIILILSSVLIGLLSSLPWSGDKWMGLWAFLPFLWNESDSRRIAFVVPLSFYLAVSRGILPGAYVFFRDGNMFQAFSLWMLSSIALSLPWGICWTPASASTVLKIFRTALCFAALIVPPLGIICWAHPLMAAGLFFSGLGWRGPALLIVFYGAGVINRKINRATIAVFLALLFFRDFPPENKTLADLKVREFNTSFGRLASGSGDFDTQYRREKMVFRYVREKERNGELESADVVVLPETLIGRMNPGTKRRWERFFSRWTDKGTVFLVGAEIPTDQGRKYDNVIAAFDGSTNPQMARQRFPVPYSMFLPFSGTGANGYPASFGSISTLEVKGKKFGVLVCYEQFLAWPFLSLISQEPDAIVAPSNLWWCKDTSLPRIQRRTLRAWTALFGIPVFISANTDIWN
jgi:apolipoprotein N-acyltransferase